MNTMQKPRCAQCKYYYVTWDKNHPYGCKKWGFKSPTIPTAAVLRASGKECQVFEQKNPKK
jgi:hypothetical protein